MISPPLHANEAERLRAFEDLDLFGPDSAAGLQEIVDLTAEICGMPIAMISMVDETRQWIRASVGLAVESTGRDISFCGHAILGNGLFEVPDAQADTRFADNPLVTGEPHIRFYAGVPLLTQVGLPLGTLCVIDRQPNRLSERQRKSLETLAQQVMNLLELRRLNRGLEAKVINQTDDIFTAYELQQQVLDGIPSQVCVLDDLGNVVFVNKSWRRFSERNGGDVTKTGPGSNFIDTLNSSYPLLGESERSVADSIMQVIQGANVAWEGVIPCENESDQLWYLCRVERLPLGARASVVVTYEDVTRLRQLETQLRASTRRDTLSYVARGIAHNVLNSTNIVSANLELLKDEPEFAGKKAISSALTELGRVSDLSRRLLSASSSQMLEPELCDAAEMIKNVVEFEADFQVPRSFELKVDIERSPLYMRVDVRELRTALANILMNARESLNGDGCIRVRAGVTYLSSARAHNLNVQSGAFVEISVADNGAGVDDKDFDRIFEPFYTTKESNRHLGLGLSVVAGFARQSHGAVTIAKSDIGGTEATLLLPCAGV